MRLTLVGLVGIVLVPLTFFPFHIPFYRNVYNDLVLDNYDHWLPCGELPLLEQVEATMTQHQATLGRIYAVAPLSGSVSVEVDAATCVGRGDLVIWYPGHRHREEIEKILGNRTFFGVPVRLRNW